VFRSVPALSHPSPLQQNGTSGPAADPEIFYVLNGFDEVFQAEGPSAGWQTVNVAEVVSIQEMSGTHSEIFLLAR
jgi:hypothetical protein